MYSWNTRNNWRPSAERKITEIIKYTVNGFPVCPGSQMWIAKEATTMDIFPTQNKLKPTKGRSISFNPALLDITSAYWGLKKIVVRRAKGFSVAWANINGKAELQKVTSNFLMNMQKRKHNISEKYFCFKLQVLDCFLHFATVTRYSMSSCKDTLHRRLLLQLISSRFLSSSIQACPIPIPLCNEERRAQLARSWGHTF